MAYKQNWGMSRSKSPLNNNNYKVENDPLNTNIIQANNQNSNKQIFTPGIDPKKQILKQVIKAKAPKASILGKVAKFAGKRALGFLDIFLGTQNAYARPRYDDKHFEDQEKEFQYKRDVEGMTKKEVMEFDGMSENAKNFIRQQRGTDKPLFDPPKEEYKPKHVFKQG